MQKLVSLDTRTFTSGLVEVLTHPAGDPALGYKFSGVRDGPTAMVLASSGIVEAIFDRMSRLPALAWLQGSIYLISHEVVERADLRMLRAALGDITIDDAILLPFAEVSDPAAEKTACQGYWTTLRLCARLGIIQGRGVSRYSAPRRCDTENITGVVN